MMCGRSCRQNFRLFCPDETNSNRLNAVFEATNRCSVGKILDSDDHVAPDGRVMEALSEHLCQGWLEGYLLTGRDGLFPCYEAFVTIIDSMFNQHAKWLKTSRELPWRHPIASLNYLLTSHAWRQDHNGHSHQGPGFMDTVINKKGTVGRIYLPPDANCLLSVMDHCLRSRIMGSWRFILVQSFVLIVWVVLNVVAWTKHWDPNPFILMNLVMSLQAAYTAPIIMMSQNRQAMRDRLEAHNDYLVNQKAEEEVRAILDHLAAQDQALAQMHELLVALQAQSSERSNDEVKP
jgi:hypothetical protein